MKHQARHLAGLFPLIWALALCKQAPLPENRIFVGETVTLPSRQLKKDMIIYRVSAKIIEELMEKRHGHR